MATEPTTIHRRSREKRYMSLKSGTITEPSGKSPFSGDLLIHKFRHRDISRGVKLQFQPMGSDHPENFTVETIIQRMGSRSIRTVQKADDFVYVSNVRGERRPLTAGYLANSAGWAIIVES